MNITVNSKKMIEALSVIQLKGQYRWAGTAKASTIGETGVLIVRANGLAVVNANSTIAAQMTIPIIERDEPDDECMIMFNVNKASKFIKNLKSDLVTIELVESMLIFNGVNAKAQMPASIEHPSLPFITKLNTMVIDHAELPKFNETQLDAQLVVDGEVLSNAIKGCSTIGNATYELNYMQMTTGTMPPVSHATLSSSNYPNLDSFCVTLPLLADMGKPASVQFSAPLDKFCSKEIMWIYIKNDAPLLLVGTDRRLVTAPYIGR